MLEPVVKKIEVPCDTSQAFSVFVDKIDSWWPKDKNSVSAMNGEVARQIIIEPRQGGRVYEIGHDETEHRWGSVAVYQPGEQLTLNWHIGLPEDKASQVDVQFRKLSDNRTEVELTHSHWERFGEKAEDMRNGYKQGWVGVFEQAYHQACQM